MTTLRIFLMGLVAMVPDEEARSLTVVLMNAIDMAHHRHIPVFVWDNRNNPDVIGDGHRLKELLEVGDVPSGYLLKGHEIYFDPKGVEPLEFVGGIGSGPSGRRLTAALPRAGNARHFSWVPSMAELTGAMGFLHPDFYSGGDSAMVAARLELGPTGGEVKTFSFADILGQVRAMRFVGVGRAPMLGMRQAVADVVVIEIDYEDDEQGVSFEGKSLDGKAGDWKVALKPYNEDGRWIIDVLIGNLTPMRDLDALVSPEPTLHFDMYHSMLALRSSYPDRLFPTFGTASMKGDGVDPEYDDLPRVIKVVSRGEKPTTGGPARPICMLASFQAPY